MVLSIEKRDPKMLTVTTYRDYQQTAYNFTRASEDNFQVGVDWANSPGVNSGGYSASFTQDRLELRGEREQWDIMVAPEGFNHSVLVMSPPNGFRSSEQPPISRVDVPTAIKAEESRKVALQVASALVGIPFMENMLSLPVPAAA